VCWERQRNHQSWSAHATERHGAELEIFGLHICTEFGECPGVLHAKKLPHEGNPPKRRPKPVQAIKAKDGYTYTPQELWSS
jgi:hypothetical protein